METNVWRRENQKCRVKGCLLAPHLNWGNFRRQNEAFVIAMDHDQDADRSRRQSPGVLISVVFLSRLERQSALWRFAADFIFNST